MWPQLNTQLRGDCKMQLLLMLILMLIELSVHVSHLHACTCHACLESNSTP